VIGEKGLTHRGGAGQPGGRSPLWPGVDARTIPSRGRGFRPSVPRCSKRDERLVSFSFVSTHIAISSDMSSCYGL
jgi:hypothetical protein